VTIAFLVEFLGVHWLTSGQKVLQHAQRRLSAKGAVLSILGTAERTPTESGSNLEGMAAQLLATKVIHEEYCEKLSLVRKF
jgi:hypothetical protein